MPFRAGLGRRVAILFEFMAIRMINDSDFAAEQKLALRIQNLNAWVFVFGRAVNGFGFALFVVSVDFGQMQHRHQFSVSRFQRNVFADIQP